VRHPARSILTLALVSLAVCSGGDELDGTSWRAVEIAGQPAMEEVAATAAFADGEVSGSSSCNSYTGTYEASSGGAYGGAPTFSITNVGGTEMACETPVMDQEARFVEALLSATTYRLDAGRLELYEDETLVAAFERSNG
jgi:heat shock protein HslJ